MTSHDARPRPQKKPIPWDVPLAVQQKLLMQPETNPTGHVPLEFAAEYRFDVTAARSRVNAWWLAESSWLAYSQDADTLRRVFRDRTGMTCEVLAVAGAEAFCAVSPQFAILSFRGTQPGDWEDLFDDASYQTVPWDVGYVHRGFARRLEHLDARLRDVIERLPKGCRVWFTGHSLGAAVATLAASRYRHVAGGVCTFGSPLVGNAVFSGTFAEALGERSVRYVNDHDVVTRVPPPPFAFPNGVYTHVDHVRGIDHDGHIGTTVRSADFVRDVFGDPATVLDVIDLHTAYANGSVTLRRRPTLPDSLRDHSPLYYVLHCWNDFVAHVDE